MALLICIECGREVSEHAASCPGCGRPKAIAVPLLKRNAVRTAALITVGLTATIGGCVALGFLLNTPDVAARSASPALSPKTDAAKIVDEWFEARSPDERVELLYRRDVNKGRFLKDVPRITSRKVTIGVDSCADIEPFGNCSVVTDDKHTPIVWLRSSNGGLLIDWRATSQVNPMTLAAFRATMPTNAAPWRLRAKLSTYFNYEFISAAATHYSFSIFEIGMTELEGIHVFARKDSEEGRSMFGALSDGAAHNVTIAMAFPETLQNNGIAKLTEFFGVGFLQTDREIEEFAGTAAY